MMESVDSRGGSSMVPGISWNHVRIQAEGYGTSVYDVQLEKGRRHVFVGQGKGLSQVVRLALGLERPSGGTVLIHGKRPWIPLGTLLVSRCLHALLSSRKLSWLGFVLARLLKAVILVEPFLELGPQEREDALRRLLQAQERSRFTLLVVTSSLDLALQVGETFEVFEGDGLRGPQGDLETVFRPHAHSREASPDQPINPVEDPVPCFVDFAGVKVPVDPTRHWVQSGDGGRGGLSVGYTVYSCSASFYVPARCVVLSPHFVHGEPSGSPPLPPSRPLPSLESGEVVAGGDPAPVPVDLVTRWIVLEGEVVHSRRLGPWVRLELHTEGWRFLADVPPAQAPQPGSRLRFGFDSAHVVRC